MTTISKTRTDGVDKAQGAQGGDPAREAVTIGRALAAALRGDDGANSGDVAYQANALLRVLQHVAPGTIPTAQLHQFAKLGHSALVLTTGDAQSQGYKLFDKALDIAGRQATAALVASADPKTKAALAVLGQLGKVEIGGTIDEKSWTLQAGSARLCNGPATSTSLSVFHPTPEEAVHATLAAITAPGAGVAVDDEKTGGRKPVAWNGKAFVDAKWDDAKNGWFPKATS
jgi:hypothetical protein